MLIEPPIEHRQDVYSSLIIDCFAKCHGSKEDMNIPIIDWAKSYKEDNVDYIKANLDSIASTVNNVMK